MIALVTGATGTVGRAVMGLLAERGHRAVPWDRRAVPPSDPEACRDFLELTRPEALFHLAVPSAPEGYENEYPTINLDWPRLLAEEATRLNYRLVFTSTVMVYGEDLPGPFTPESEADAPPGYPAEKLEAEGVLRDLAPDHATSVRLGWQINQDPSTNSMARFLRQQQDEHGAVRASVNWRPACAFADDSAAALLHAVNLPPDLYLADANSGHSFFDIARALSDLMGGGYDVRPADEPDRDQRMLDARLPLLPLTTRLPTLNP